MLISEIEEELKNCISNYLWFIPQKINDSSSTGVYFSKVGRDDFKGTFLTICFKIIFDKKRFPEKIANMLKRTNIKHTYGRRE